MAKERNKSYSRSSRRRETSKQRSRESSNTRQTGLLDDSSIDDAVTVRRSQTADALMWTPFIDGDDLKVDTFEADALKDIPLTEESTTVDDDASTSPWKPRSTQRSNEKSDAHSLSRSRSTPTRREEELAARRRALEDARRRNDEKSRKIDEMMGVSEKPYRRTKSAYESTTDDSSESDGSRDKTKLPKKTETTEYNLGNSTRVLFSFTFRVEWAISACIIIGLVAGGLAAFFLTRVESTLPAAPDLTSVQSQPPSLSPSSSPTRQFFYDPPLPQDCGGIGIGADVAGQDLLTERNFDLTLDVTMRAQVGESETMELLKWEMQKKLIPKLVGCESQNRKLRDHRMLRNPNRYIVGNGKFQFQPETVEVNEQCSDVMCFSGTFNMKLFLRSPAEQYFVIVNLVSDIFGDNLVDSLELESPAFVSVVARTLTPTITYTPSSSPSMLPSHEPATTFLPSLLPSEIGSQAPTELASQQPTLSPTENRPTVSPTRGPTLPPTVSGSPTTVGPTRVPTRRPTGFPTIEPTPPPTRSPTAAPSSQPTRASDMNGYYQQFDRPIRVACAGDSLTRGRDGGNIAAHTYPAQLKQMLGQDDFLVYNFGRNAATGMHGMSISYADKHEFQNSLNINPDIYLLMLGTNDSRYWESDAHRFPEGMRMIVNKVKSLASSPRIILAIPPWVKTDIYGISNDIVSNNVRVEIERVAGEFNLQVVNMHDVTVNQADHFISDGLHLNQQGYAALAEAWKEAIECDYNGICDVGENCISCPDCYLNCPQQA